MTENRLQGDYANGSQDAPELQNAAATPPVVDPPIVAHQSPPLFETLDINQWFESRFGEDVYGAPRVFDLYTLLSVTVAFALLFTFLRFIEPLLMDSLPQVAISLGFFLTLIAIAQMILWGGDKPRAASISAGPVVWVIVGLGLFATSPSFRILFFVLFTTPAGFFAGYVAGGLVAGVFLVADSLRKKFVRAQSATGQTAEEQIWGESALPDSGQESA